MTNNRPLHVFLCHSKDDKPIVRELYQKLSAESWIEPWLDEEKLYPGQDWNLEIEKAIEVMDVILVCLSKNSITKEGYVQKEIKTALDFSDYKPDGTVFIIPLRLEECVPPMRLSKWQYEDYFGNNRNRAIQRLLVSLKKRAISLGLDIERNATKEEKEKQVFSKIPQSHQVSLSPKKFFLSNRMEFMCVPAGDFIMGCSSNQEDREKPQHTVDIPYDYWMARFPVTNMMYSLYTGAHQIKHPIDGWENKKNHPVAKIKWMDAVTYCQWLNKLVEREIPSGLVLRLPTEAEWEKAARGTDGREYPWGNRFDGSKCNTSSNELSSLFSIIKGGTTPVNKYSPRGDSPYGCADMAGNVWEWTHSLMDEYPYQPDDGREDEESPGSRVLRGGSFFDNQWYARCAYRHEYTLDFFLYSHIGFRVAIAPPVE